MRRGARRPPPDVYKRQTLRNALSGLLDAGRIEAAGIDPGARAETLDLAAVSYTHLDVYKRQAYDPGPRDRPGANRKPVHLWR